MVVRLNNNLINILLRAEVDSKAVSNIYKQIEDISKNAKAIKINIDIDGSALQAIENINKSIAKSNAYLMPKIDTSQLEKGVQSITHHFKSGEKEASSMTKTTVAGFEKTVEVLKKVDGVYSEISKKNVTSNYEQIRKLTEQIELYQQKMRGDMDIFSEKNKGKFNQTQLDNLRTRMENLSVASGNARREMKEITIEMGHLQKAAANSNSTLAKITDNLVKFARFYIVGQAVVNLKNSIQGGINSIKELDVSLTELSKVSDLTGSQLKSFTDRAYDAGRAISRTGKEVIDATTEFRKAGYDIETAFKLSQDALLFTNIADGIDDAKEASSSMIAILKGFNMEAESSTHIINALNEVSNNFAVDTNNLTEVLKRTSGTIAQTGTSYEELIGLATGGYESLRNAEMVASGKTFCPYVQKCA